LDNATICVDDIANCAGRFLGDVIKKTLLFPKKVEEVAASFRFVHKINLTETVSWCKIVSVKQCKVGEYARFLGGTP
jgi:hypothetical protein